MNFGAIGRRALEERNDLVAPWYHRAARLVRRAPHQAYSHDARGPEDDARGRGGHGRGAIVTNLLDGRYETYVETRDRVTGRLL